MRRAFPGLDPRLHHTGLRPDIRSSLIVSSRDALSPTLRPRSFAGMESRTILTKLEVPSHQGAIVVEVLSPTKKKTKEPCDESQEERREMLGSGVTLMEIDLLPERRPMPPGDPLHRSDYRIHILRPKRDRNAHLCGFSHKTAIPVIPIPLLPGDGEPSLDLNRRRHSLYERAGYDLAIDDRQQPQSRLRKADEAWAEDIFAQAGIPSSPSPAGGEPSP